MIRAIRQSLWVYMFILVIIITASYMYFLNFMKNSYEANLASHKRCFSELDSIKYQLNVVTEYKNRLDKLLIETQKKFDVEKERHKEIMDSCLAMKQQSAICQSQFEDLQYECKKMKVDLDNFKREREKLKPMRINYL